MAGTTELVRSEGIFHGLPAYPTDSPEYKNLTAIVTGATGISGYHMLKVLTAAPERWSKIYTLSRRPVPDYFLKELGPGRDRIHHVEADFLADPTTLAKTLKSTVEKVDHIFFFSYMQPARKGGVLGMWSEADELAKVNGNLVSNFLGALKIAGLPSTMASTSAATNPSFESDPRILLESNFYYPQEDHLIEFCSETGTQWNVVRPSYIIGAVRDNLLNHMVGIGVYVSIQAYLKRPVQFAGDYVAWDREFCQSTAMLNAYLEEWAVLNPAVGNEAFNVQDGLPFTWGRFWPSLAQWYATSWAPPEDDPSKYRIAESRWEKTPRGYGPQGVTRTSFSLLEWSEGQEVQAAWKELKEKHGLLLEPFKDAAKRAQIFAMSDSAIISGWALSLSMRKSRRMGFHGTVDSYEAAFHTLRDLAKLRVLPPLAASVFTE
ncbi:hypothetical protein GQ53DRAFT_861451 [Thozetella sp. PMI_491]|nr:hypothetical protein GQ53DRAFT_861451 [Thozetella sp. PMI_491]